MATGSLEHGVGADLPDLPPWGATPDQHTIWPTPLQADLLRATLLADERALAAWKRIRPQLKVAEMDFATQALLPYLRHNLLALGVQDELLVLFKGVHRYTWARNQLLLAQAMPMVEALERAGVSTLMLKGAALVAGQRQNAGMRKMTDIDVLVPTDTLAAACQVLADRGMTPIKGAPLWWVTEYAPSFTPSFGFTNAAEAQLDLHWHALHNSCQPGADEDLWAAAATVELNGVRTRALDAADELLLLVTHGLRWSPSPTYRWVLDATLIIRGLAGPVDYDRLAGQARRHRVAPAVRAGLRYLLRTIGIDIPAAAVASLRVAAPIQRLELRAQAIQPSRRSRIEQAAVHHGGYLRHHAALGRRVTPATHVLLAADRLGVRRVTQIRALGRGGRPGPGRPYLGTTAPLGTGVATPAPLGWGEPLDFSQPRAVREHCLYGLCYPHDAGSWIAGREARIVLELPEPARSSLVLQLAAWGLVRDRCPRQRLQIHLDGERLAMVVFDAAQRAVEAEAILLPARMVAGRSRLEIVLRAPDAISPARLGINDDVRPLGVFLQRMCVRRPRRCSLGERVSFGAGSGDRQMLAGGWADPPDANGRWTLGPEARLLLSADAVPEALEWSADPFMPDNAPPLQVDVHANGVPLGTVDYRDAPSTMQLPLGNAAGPGELLLSWRIREPRAPSRYLASEDRRPLGLLFHSVALM